MAQALLPRYARAQTISFTDERIKARYVNYSITARCMRAFQPAGMRPDI